MRLSYRGTQYDLAVTPVDMANSRLVGTYRGQDYSVKYPRHIPVPQAVADLSYRGVAYRTTATGGVESIAQRRTDRVAAADPIGMTLVRHASHQQDGMHEAHRQNILNRLQHRLMVAKSQGNDNLVHQLEREMQTFA